MIAASGILSWVTRVADQAELAYPIYFIHLVFVFSLFIYLPYSKLAHMFYRGAALCFVRYSRRDVVAGSAAGNEEPTVPLPTAEKQEEGEAEQK